MKETKSLKKTKVKKQHYVPRAYLKNFCTNGEQLYVLDKSQRKYFKANIKDIACGNYFYDIDAKDSQSFEKSLGVFEAAYAGIFDNLIQKLNAVKNNTPSNLLEVFLKKIGLLHKKNINLTPSERLVIAGFFAVQYLRTAHTRQEITQTSQKLFEIISSMSDEVEKPDGFYPSYQDDSAMTSIHVNIIKELGEQCARYLMEQKWIFGVNRSSRPLFTSDNPAILDTSFCENRLIRNDGFMSPNVQFYLPLNNDFVLLIIEKSFYKKYKQLISNQNVSDFNDDAILYSNNLQLNRCFFQIYSNTDKFFEEEKNFCIKNNIDGNKNRKLIWSNQDHLMDN